MKILAAHVPAYLQGFETSTGVYGASPHYRVPAYLQGFETEIKQGRSQSDSGFQHTYKGSKRHDEFCLTGCGENVPAYLQGFET